VPNRQRQLVGIHPHPTTKNSNHEWLRGRNGFLEFISPRSLSVVLSDLDRDARQTLDLFFVDPTAIVQVHENTSVMDHALRIVAKMARDEHPFVLVVLNARSKDEAELSSTATAVLIEVAHKCGRGKVVDYRPPRKDWGRPASWGSRNAWGDLWTLINPDTPDTSPAGPSVPDPGGDEG